jgi:phospholipid/cholesterol/gamma-HCH transport system permease protein
MRDLIVGLGKSVIFAFVIGLVASDEGLNVQGRVAAIGEATTRAVVYSVLGVLAADTLVNVIFYFIPGLA